MSELDPRAPNLRLLAWPAATGFPPAVFSDLVLPPPLLLALADRDLAAASVIASALRASGHACRVLAPPASTGGAWLRLRATDWRAVAVAGLADRLDRVWLPAPLSGGGSIIAVNDLRSNQAPRAPIALGIWARFAHPRQRTGAALSAARDGLTAEIALAVRPRLVLLSATWQEISLFFAATDQIAAELAGLAFIQLTANSHEREPHGPWEAPLVQRATELGLGVRVPSELRTVVCWLGREDDDLRATFMTFADTLLSRIGVNSHG